MPELFMNKIRVSVADNTVLTFLLDDPTVCNDKRVRFLIGGVWFETSEEVVTFIKDSFFTAYLANPMNAAANDTENLKERVLNGPPFESAELFPLIFDFMVRKRYDCSSMLRTVALTKEQALKLDEIENFLFPSTEPMGTDRPISATGPKYSINPNTNLVQVALLPEYRSTGSFDPSHVAEKGRDFIYHEHCDICLDPRFVDMVIDYQKSHRKKSYTLNAAMVNRLNADYDLAAKPITLDVIKHCKIVTVYRGEPFVVLAEQDSGVSYLDVLTEEDGGLEWNIA